MFEKLTKVINKKFLYTSNRIITNRMNSTVTYNNSFKVQTVDDFNERVRNSTKPVIVDFFATWCNPCKILLPRIESVIDEQKGKILLAKVDIDEHSELAMDYEVKVVPVLLAFRNGKAEDRLIGVHDADKLRTFVNKYIQE